MSATPGPLTNYIPALNGKVLIDYSRNPKDFAVNQIVAISPVDKQIGYYAKFDPSAQARLLSANLTQWADGTPLPISHWDRQEHTFNQYVTRRYARAIPLGYLMIEQSEWDAVAQQQAVLASWMMHNRTDAVYDVLKTSGNYASGHTDTATNIGGGKLDVATSSNNYIQKAFNAVANQITKATYGIVSKESLTAVMSPYVAYKLAQTQEVREAYIQSQFADSLIQGNGTFNVNFGLPPKLYGINIVVDPTMEVTTNVNTSGTATKDYNAFTTSISIVARKGDLVNTSPFATSFASVHLFVYNKEEMEMTVEDDKINRRKILTMVDHFQAKMVAPETCYLITACVD